MENPVRFVDPSGLIAELADTLNDGAGNAVDAATILNLGLAAAREPLTSISPYVRAGNILSSVSDALTPVTVVLDTVDTYRDFTNPAVSKFTASKNAVVRAADFAASDPEINPYALEYADFKLSKATGDYLFGPKPQGKKALPLQGSLNPVIEGGHIGGVPVPGLGDFTKDVVLDPISETVSGAKAAGSWISKKWNSLW
jgi:hypothetical protein